MRNPKTGVIHEKVGSEEISVANLVVNMSQKSMPLFPQAVMQIVRLTSEAGTA